MKIAIIILNWNGKQLLEQFLPSIINNSQNIADIIVADNASTDDSIVFLKENFKEVQIIENTINGGYAKGYNDALQHVNADIYALVNSDIEVSKGWLEPIIKQFESAPDTAAIQPKILDYKDKAMFEYAGAGGGFIDKYGYPYCRGRVFNTLEKDEGQYNDIIDIFWASGACFFIRSEVYHKLNGFDESYFAHQEEIDLCWRIHNAGYTVQYVGLSTVYHVGGATLSEENSKKTYLNFRNSLFTILKNVPRKSVFGVLFLRMVLDGFAFFKFLAEFRPTHSLAILKAHFSFYRNLNRFFKKRSDLKQTKVDYFNVKSIVWSYFVLGRKKFKKLINS